MLLYSNTKLFDKDTDNLITEPAFCGSFTRCIVLGQLVLIANVFEFYHPNAELYCIFKGLVNTQIYQNLLAFLQGVYIIFSGVILVIVGGLTDQGIYMDLFAL